MVNIKLNASTRRSKELIQKYGSIWRVLGSKSSVESLGYKPGHLISSIPIGHTQWVESDDIEKGE